MPLEELYIGGAFDIFSPDHRSFIIRSYETAIRNYPIRRLVIGLLTDLDVASRGQHRPFFPYEWRHNDILKWFTSSPFSGIEGLVEETYHFDFYRGKNRERFAQRIIVINTEYKDQHWVQQVNAWHPYIQFVEPIDKVHTTDILVELLRAKETSRCLYRKVGAILLRNGEIVVSGSSGPEFEHDKCENCSKYQAIMEGFRKTEKIEPSPVLCDFSHAEIKCLPYSQIGDDILVTTKPCHYCAKEIISHGIRRVVYLEPHNDSLALSILDDNNIQHRHAGLEHKLGTIGNQ